MDVQKMAPMHISPAYLQRLRLWAAPKRFTQASTEYDMGYEQAKRDLIALMRSMIPSQAFDEPLPEEPEEKPKKGFWRLLT